MALGAGVPGLGPTNATTWAAAFALAFVAWFVVRYGLLGF